MASQVRFIADVWAIAQNMSLLKTYGHAELEPTFAPMETGGAAAAAGAAATPSPLGWVITPVIQSAIDVQSRQFMDLVQSNESRCLAFNDFGKKELKSWGMSPDGVIQAAFQTAYYRIHRDARISVYESASTKSWRIGRTEAIRSTTMESSAFARAMADHTSDHGGPRDAKIALLLKESTIRHRSIAQAASNCQGVDRHLFSLANVARLSGDPMPSLYTDVMWGRLNTSILSTSNVNSPALEWLAFGAVCSQGYGVG